MRRWWPFAPAAALAILAACAAPQSKPEAATVAPPPRPLRPGLDPARLPDPFGSTYRPGAAEPFAIVNATILTAAGPTIRGGAIIVRDGKVAAVGSEIAVPADVRIIEAAGRYVTPGIVDPHSHLGGGPMIPGSGGGGERGNAGNPAALWIENSVWAQDPMFGRALEAGVTTLQILPGSGNIINGRSVILKNVPAVEVKAMKFPGAAAGLKMACGENPGNRSANMRDYRTTFISAAEYVQRWQAWRRRGTGDAPKRDLAMENVGAALTGDLKVQFHCYRADDMLQMIDLSKEFGFKIAAFHHANEAFKVAKVLAAEGVAVVTWAGDWSGYKMEAFDSIMETPAFVERAGGIVSMHSDDPRLIQHLNHEAARAMTAGREAGLGTTEEQAIRWITINPAKIIGVAERTGSLEPGKMADIVLWDTNPFSVYALPDLVFIDGVLVHDRAHPRSTPRSDFELGNARRRAPAPNPVPQWEDPR